MARTVKGGIARSPGETPARFALAGSRSGAPRRQGPMDPLHPSAFAPPGHGVANPAAVPSVHPQLPQPPQLVNAQLHPLPGQPQTGVEGAASPPLAQTTPYASPGAAPDPGALLPGNLPGHLNAPSATGAPAGSESFERERQHRLLSALADPRVPWHALTAGDWHHADRELGRFSVEKVWRLYDALSETGAAERKAPHALDLLRRHLADRRRGPEVTLTERNRGRAWALDTSALGDDEGRLAGLVLSLPRVRGVPGAVYAPQGVDLRGLLRRDFPDLGVMPLSAGQVRQAYDADPERAVGRFSAPPPDDATLRASTWEPVHKEGEGTFTQRFGRLDRLTAPDGREFYAKSFGSDPGPATYAEAAASRVLRLLGNRNVPAAAVREPLGYPTLFTPRLPGKPLWRATPADLEEVRRVTHPRELQRLVLGHWLVSADDRHQGQYVVHQGRVYPLDYGASLAPGTPREMWGRGEALLDHPGPTSHEEPAFYTGLVRRAAPFDMRDVDRALGARDDTLRAVAAGIPDRYPEFRRQALAMLGRKFDALERFRESGLPFAPADLPEFLGGRRRYGRGGRPRRFAAGFEAHPVRVEHTGVFNSHPASMQPRPENPIHGAAARAAVGVGLRALLSGRHEAGAVDAPWQDYSEGGTHHHRPGAVLIGGPTGHVTAWAGSVSPLDAESLAHGLRHIIPAPQGQERQGSVAWLLRRNELEQEALREGFRDEGPLQENRPRVEEGRRQAAARHDADVKAGWHFARVHLHPDRTLRDLLSAALSGDKGAEHALADHLAELGYQGLADRLTPAVQGSREPLGEALLEHLVPPAGEGSERSARGGAAEEAPARHAKGPPAPSDPDPPAAGATGSHPWQAALPSAHDLATWSWRPNPRLPLGAGGHSHRSGWLVGPQGQRLFAKQADSARDAAVELAAAAAHRLLGTPNVPALARVGYIEPATRTQKRRVLAHGLLVSGEVPGGLTLAHANDWADDPQQRDRLRALVASRGPDDLAKQALAHWYLSASDRHPDQYVVGPEGHIVPIDYGLSFAPHDEWPGGDALFHGGDYGWGPLPQTHPVPAGFLENLLERGPDVERLVEEGVLPHIDPSEREPWLDELKRRREFLARRLPQARRGWLRFHHLPGELPPEGPGRKARAYDLENVRRSGDNGGMGTGIATLERYSDPGEPEAALPSLSSHRVGGVSHPHTRVRPVQPEELAGRLRAFHHFASNDWSPAHVFRVMEPDADALTALAHRSGWDVIGAGEHPQHGPAVEAYPLTVRPAPAAAYHWLPAELLARVLRQGILPASPGRGHGGAFDRHRLGKVFLAGSPVAAQWWGGAFRRHFPDVDWRLLRVNLAGVRQPAFEDFAVSNDPSVHRLADSLYYIARRVPRERLTTMNPNELPETPTAPERHAKPDDPYAGLRLTPEDLWSRAVGGADRDIEEDDLVPEGEDPDDPISGPPL